MYLGSYQWTSANWLSSTVLVARRLSPLRIWTWIPLSPTNVPFALPKILITCPTLMTLSWHPIRSTSCPSSQRTTQLLPSTVSSSSSTTHMSTGPWKTWISCTYSVASSQATSIGMRRPEDTSRATYSWSLASTCIWSSAYTGRLCTKRGSERIFSWLSSLVSEAFTLRFDY